MKSLKKADRIILVILILIAAMIIYFLYTGTDGQDAASGEGTAAARTFADYAGKRIGSATGTTYDQSILANIEDPEILYFSSYGDMLAALLTNRIDAFCADEPAVRYMMLQNDGVSFLPERLEKYDFAFAFAKSPHGRDLCGQFSEFIREAEKDGTLAELDKKWFGGDEGVLAPPDLNSLSAENGTLKLAADLNTPPFMYMINAKAAGFDADTAYLFCQKYGYGLEIISYNFDAIMPAVQSGLCDMAACSITITEERAQSVNFSEPYYHAGAVLAVKASDLGPEDAQGSPLSILRSLASAAAESFDKTFLRERRWKLTLEGIGVTCLITLLSALFGTLLAFLICMFRRLDSCLSNRICDIYVKVLQGTPLVVLLMILYYLVFARTSVDSVAIAVIGFTLNFAAYVSEIMYSGIKSIDSGQREAALALGFTENQAFFRFIFPQAAVQFLPVYLGEIISLLKSTSIVGYIAIQDLTRISDIIRSRTYEPFFPLISTALIYFLLAWLLTALLKYLFKAVNPRRTNRRKEDSVK